MTVTVHGMKSTTVAVATSAPSGMPLLMMLQRRNTTLLALLTVAIAPRTSSHPVNIESARGKGVSDLHFFGSLLYTVVTRPRKPTAAHQRQKAHQNGNARFMGNVLGDQDPCD